MTNLSNEHFLSAELRDSLRTERRARLLAYIDSRVEETQGSRETACTAWIGIAKAILTSPEVWPGVERYLDMVGAV